MSSVAVEREAQVVVNPDFAQTHLLTRIDRFTLAIPIASVISIHEAPLIFPMPCAQPGIMGAIRFQGVAVPVFDLRRSLRLAPRSLRQADRLVLLDAGVRSMGIIVEDVMEFARLRADSTAVLDTLFGDSPINAKIIAGIACAPELCAILDPAGMLQPDVWDAQTIHTLFEHATDSNDPLWPRTAALANIPQRSHATGVEAAVFAIAGQRYAVPLAAIVEFFTAAPHSPIPVRANIAVSLLNRRGEALMLFDPRPVLGLAPARLAERVDGIVLSSDDWKMAVPVDALEGLRSLPNSDASMKPGRLCLSVHPSDRGAVLLLDVPAFLQTARSAFAGQTASSLSANA